MRGARSIQLRRNGKKAPRKLARIGRVPKEGTAEAAAFKKLVAEAVESAMKPYFQRLEALLTNPARTREDGVLVRGRLRYRPGFEDVWVGDTPFDLRERSKARLCLQYLVEKKAFDASSARHLVDEIDPYVRERGKFPRAAEIKIGHYFNDRRGKLRRLRRELIASAGRNGCYFLRVD